MKKRICWIEKNKERVVKEVWDRAVEFEHPGGLGRIRFHLGLTNFFKEVLKTSTGHMAELMACDDVFWLHIGNIGKFQVMVVFPLEERQEAGNFALTWNDFTQERRQENLITFFDELLTREHPGITENSTISACTTSLTWTPKRPLGNFRKKKKKKETVSGSTNGLPACVSEKVLAPTALESTKLVDALETILWDVAFGDDPSRPHMASFKQELIALRPKLKKAARSQ